MLPFKNQRLLIVAPHPDDEVLGCGGLIQKVKDEGGKVYVLFMTVGDTKEYSQNGSSTLNERMKEIEGVANFLHYDDYAVAFAGNQYHLRLDTIAKKDLVDQIESGYQVSLNLVKPTILATPYLSDYNQDHLATTQAVFSAARPVPEDVKPFQNIVLGYECVSVADWWEKPRTINTFLPLSEIDLERKISALALYKSQIRLGYHARSLASIKTLARYRGLHIAEEAAEAFCSYRFVL